MRISFANFLRISLLMPYVLAALLYWLSGVFDPYDPSAGQVPMGFFATMVELVSVVYLLGAIYWFIPYTILILAFLVWSRKKTKTEMFRVLIWTPFFLAILITGFSAFMSLLNFWPGFSPKADLSVGICAFPLSLFFGYVFIGATAWIYDFLKSRNIVVDEEAIIVDGN